MGNILKGFEPMGGMVDNVGERHIACVLLVDTSNSMHGDPIAELNRGLMEFGDALNKDEHARGVADVCVISFGGKVKRVVPFSPACNYNAPTLSSDGGTCMNEAIIKGLDAIEERKQLYRELGCTYYRPWMFLLTDGEPTDKKKEKEARCRLKQALDDKKVNFFPMGIGKNADYALLKTYTKDGNGAVLKATSDQFKEAFVWLSSSMSVIGNSDPSLGNVTLEPMPVEIELI